jgi:hypothetical protein
LHECYVRLTRFDAIIEHGILIDVTAGSPAYQRHI